jgi:hypothetical protein
MCRNITELRGLEPPATDDEVDALPARRQPPATVPPLRRPEVRARIAARDGAGTGS